MKARELRELTQEEVILKKEEAEKELFNLKIRQATRQIDNPLKLRILKRDIAKIKTVLKEHELRIRPLAEGQKEFNDRQTDEEKQA
jgi:large subunit ribosomal protein L29